MQVAKIDANAVILNSGTLHIAYRLSWYNKKTWALPTDHCYVQHHAMSCPKTVHSFVLSYLTSNTILAHSVMPESFYQLPPTRFSSTVYPIFLTQPCCDYIIQVSIRWSHIFKTMLTEAKYYSQVVDVNLFQLPQVVGDCYKIIIFQNTAAAVSVLCNKNVHFSEEH